MLRILSSIWLSLWCCQPSEGQQLTMAQPGDAVLGISLSVVLGGLGISQFGHHPFPGIHVPVYSLSESAALLGTSATSLIRQELKGKFNATAAGLVRGFGYEFNDFLTHFRSSRCRMAPA